MAREISLTLTAAAEGPSSVAAATSSDTVVISDGGKKNTPNINYAVECASARQTRAVNTYVSRRSSLHGNLQHPDACFLLYPSLEVDCFHGNHTAVFDGELEPTDKASEMDG